MNKRLIVLLVMLGMVCVVSAQHKSYAEKKKTARNKIENERVFGDDDLDFNTIESPEKWKDESAIILCQKFDYSYLRKGMNSIVFKETLRKRIKINDKKAKDEFSIFYYRDALISKDYLGFKVIKPDGKTVDVDLSDGVEVAANEVPKVYRSNYYYSASYKKIAIPNLEVGDIIDYYYSTQNVFSLSLAVDGIYSYSPFAFTLSKSYPILKQKFFYNVDVGFKVSYRTFNGAPDLVEGKAGVNRLGKTKDHIKTYSLVDVDREKKKSEYWKYQFLNEPTIKFQVNYVPRAKVTKTELLVTSEDLMNKPFDLKMIQTKLGKGTDGMALRVSDVTKYIKRNHKTETDPEKIADLAYYYLRYNYFQNYYFEGYYSNIDKYKEGDEISLKAKSFVNTLYEVLKNLRVKSELIIAVEREYGTFNDVLLGQEMSRGLRVGGKYYFYLSNFSTPDYIPAKYQGAEAIVFKPSLKYEKVPYEEIVITPSTYQKNLVKTDLEVTFNEDFSTSTLKSKEIRKGEAKSYFSYLALWHEDYFEKDKIKYDPHYKGGSNKPKTNKISKRTQFKLDEEKRKEEAVAQENLDNKFKTFIQYHEDDYKISKYNSFKVISDGRFAENPDLITESEYEVEEIVNKAGRNFIFNVGALIGSQLELDKDDVERLSAIDLSFAKSYEYQIEIKIPEGYKVDGVDQLNISVDNKNGAFISSAKVDAGLLIVNTVKTYKVISAPKEEWNNYVEFLEAAYEFSQKKLILKKITS